MAAGTWNWLLRAKQKLAMGVLTLSGEVIKMGLWRATSNLSNTVDVSTVASITNQLPGERGYSQNGESVSNWNLAVSATTAWALDGDGTCWSANGGVLGSGNTSIQYAVLWRSATAAGSGMPIAYATLSTSDFTVPAGSALQINGGLSSSNNKYLTLT